MLLSDSDPTINNSGDLYISPDPIIMIYMKRNFLAEE